MKQLAIFLGLSFGYMGCYPDALLLDGALENGGGGGTAVNLGGSTSGGSTQSTSAVAPTFRSFAACEAPYASVVVPADQKQLTELMAGDWYLCGATSAFCTTDEVGMRINSDGTWIKLFADASGTITEAPSSAQWSAGTWVSDFNETSTGPSVSDAAGLRNLGFRTADVGFMVFPEFVTGGAVMTLNDTVCTATYVKSTKQDDPGVAHDVINGIPVEQNARSTVTVDSTLLATCDVNTNNFEVTSLDTVKQSVEGVWMLCPSSSVGCNAGEAALQFDNEGNWFRLYADDAGTLGFGLGATQRGKYAVVGDVANYELVANAFGRPGLNFGMSITAAGVTRFDTTGFSSCSGFYQKIAP